jgi:hypothetical protein
MERPGRAVEGGDAQSSRRERVGERDPLAPVAEELAEPEMGRPRLSATGDLDGAAADPGSKVQGVLERKIADRIGVEAEVQGSAAHETGVHERTSGFGRTASPTWWSSS